MTRDIYTYDENKYCYWDHIPFLVFEGEEGQKRIIRNLDYENPFLEIMSTETKNWECNQSSDIRKENLTKYDKKRK